MPYGRFGHRHFGSGRAVVFGAQRRNHAASTSANDQHIRRY
jgi:hypothetical protein